MEKSGLIISIVQSVNLIDFIAAASHITRIRNTLRTPGVNNTERQVYAQRAKNMAAAQNAYLALQKNALSCVE